MKTRLTLLAFASLITCAYCSGVTVHHTNEYMVVSLNDFGASLTLRAPPDGLDHVFQKLGIVSYGNSGMRLDRGFAVAQPLEISGNVAHSAVTNRELRVEITTTFPDDSYYDQRYVVSNRSTVSLDTFTLSQYQDGDLLHTVAGDTVGRDAQTRALYQTESNLYLGIAVSGAGYTMPTHYSGGNQTHVRTNSLANRFDNMLAQSTDTGVLVGRRFGTLGPGQVVAILVRHAVATGLDEFRQKVSQTNIELAPSKLKFGVKWNKNFRDKLSFRGLVNLGSFGITDLTGYALTINIEDSPVVETLQGTVKTSKNGSKAKYKDDVVTAFLRLENGTGDARVKVVMKKALLGERLGLVDDGQFGTLNLNLQLGLRGAEEVRSDGPAVVPYSNKLNKHAKGKQLKQ